MGLALVTGASAGLGSEFVKLFADDGHAVILVARRRDRMLEIVRALQGFHSKFRAHVIELDLSESGSGERLHRAVAALKLPPVDFLVNNAGFGTNGVFAELPPARETEMVELNVRSLVEITAHFLPEMRQRGSGRILNVGSVAGFQPGPRMATYYASKAFVNSFSEALAEELRGSGVSCTLLAPGPTATEFAELAGLQKSRLFRLSVASSRSVAHAGYSGMMRGRTTVIPGWLNLLMVQALRVTPRFLARKIAGRLNES